MIPKISLFKDLSESELEALQNLAVKVEVRRGEILFNEGDQNWDLYIIESGEAEISVSDLTGTQKVISRLREGDFFGEMSLLDRTSPRSTTAKVIRSGSLIRLPAEKLGPLLDDPTPMSRSIHIKIMQALSRRLREVTQRAAAVLKSPEDVRGRTLTFVSAGNGCGKTTLATTMAHIIARECKRKVLLLDLDLHYADGTFLMGVYNQKSIITLARDIRSLQTNTEQVQSHFTNVHDDLWILAAPNSIADAEQLHVEDLATIVGYCQKLFDYVIIDTNEGINPTVLSAIESAEHTFFMLNTQDILSIKNAVRFFQLLTTIKFPENRISVLANKAKDDFRPEQLPKTRLRIAGCLPEFVDNSRKEGKTLYQIEPQNRFCIAVRGLIRSFLKEEITAVATQKGIPPKTNFAFKAENSNGNGSLNNHQNGDIRFPKISPDTLSILINELKLLMEEGMLHEAETEARKLLKLCHDSSELYQVFGEILVCREIPDEAIIVFRKSLELNPKNALTMGMLGHILGDHEQLARAIQQMNEQCQGAARFADRWNDLGRLHGLAGNYDAAQKAFRKALELNPKFCDAQINLAVALGETGNPEQALRELDKLANKGLRGHYLAGCFQQLQGAFADAYSEFQKAAIIRKEYHDLASRLEHLSAYFSQMESLVQMHRGYLARHPNFPDLHFKLAELYIQMAKDDEALSELQEAIRLKPNYEEAKQKVLLLKKKKQPMSSSKS